MKELAELKAAHKYQGIEDWADVWLTEANPDAYLLLRTSAAALPSGSELRAEIEGVLASGYLAQSQYESLRERIHAAFPRSAKTNVVL